MHLLTFLCFFFFKECYSSCLESLRSLTTTPPVSEVNVQMKAAIRLIGDNLEFTEYVQVTINLFAQLILLHSLLPNSNSNFIMNFIQHCVYTVLIAVSDVLLYFILWSQIKVPWDISLKYTWFTVDCFEVIIESHFIYTLYFNYSLMKSTLRCLSLNGYSSLLQCNECYRFDLFLLIRLLSKLCRLI